MGTLRQLESHDRPTLQGSLHELDKNVSQTKSETFPGAVQISHGVFSVLSKYTSRFSNTYDNTASLSFSYRSYTLCHDYNIYSTMDTYQLEENCISGVGGGGGWERKGFLALNSSYFI